MIPNTYRRRSTRGRVPRTRGDDPYLVNMVRNELHVGCKNGIAPALARIMEARYPDLQGAFNKHRSQSDGFSE